MKRSPGVTLTELIVAVAIVSIAVLGIIGSFNAIAISVQHSKMRTLATNLAQEKMQILRQSSYYRLLLTTAAAYDTSFSPAVAYDTSYYPPETILEGGTYFNRLTHVQMASEISGTLTPLGPASDTGMKLMTVTVTWQQGMVKRKLQLQSVKSNPRATMATSVFTGMVRDRNTNIPIPDATVMVAENMGWQDTTESDGTYAISVYSGNYSLIASAQGYFDEHAAYAIAENQTLPGTDFLMSPQSWGTVTGSAWLNNHIVISQVVGSSVSAAGFDQEYVELYNPTTSYFPMVIGMGMPQIDLKYQHRTIDPLEIISLNYAIADSSIPPKGYFLIANTTTIEACGVTRAADAVYTIPGQNIIQAPAGGAVGAVGIMPVGGAAWIDCVGWEKDGQTVPFFEAPAIDQHIGFSAGEQYVRRTSTHNALGFGRCYDTGNNERDFVDQSMWAGSPPRNRTDTELAIAGTPAVGAVISCNDDLSFPKTADSVGNPPWARIELPQVATGTWTMMITSNTFTIEISSVTISTDGQVLGVPNAGTVPPWPVANHTSCMLDTTAQNGFISGQVKNAAGIAITPAIKVRAGSAEVDADVSTGKYIIPLASGTYSVTANPGNVNPQYISQVIENVAVEVGQITSNQDFALAKGGMISAWVTRDKINPLPGVAVVVLDSNGNARAQDVSKSNGRVLLINIATGTYTIKPILDSGEKSSPASSTATVVAGATVFASSFTISGAFGTITGAVTSGTKPISTGVLIVASTATLSSPPTVTSALAASAAIYTTNSYENGTYALDVRGSSVTAYQVYAYYPVSNGSSFIVMKSTVTDVYVNQGQTVPGVNFGW